MEQIVRYFPLSADVEAGDWKSFLIPMIIYLAACGVLRVLSVVLGLVPLVGWLLELVFSLMGLYCVAGIILCILRFVRH